MSSFYVSCRTFSPLAAALLGMWWFSGPCAPVINDVTTLALDPDDPDAAPSVPELDFEERVRAAGDAAGRSAGWLAGRGRDWSGPLGALRGRVPAARPAVSACTAWLLAHDPSAPRIWAFCVV